MMLLGIVGHKGSGKDTSIGCLGDDWVNFKFAAPLKSMMSALLFAAGYRGDQVLRMLEGDLKEVPSVTLGGQTPRHAMQTLGTQWGRKQISETLWIDVSMELAARAVAANKKVLFTDVRFPNEVEAIRANGGYLVRITRPGLMTDTSHESEQYIPDLTVDYEIFNDGTPEELQQKLKSIVDTNL